MPTGEHETQSYHQLMQKCCFNGNKNGSVGYGPYTTATLVGSNATRGEGPLLSHHRATGGSVKNLGSGRDSGLTNNL